ncbi:MAG: hypothetical protein K9L17_14075 [Clostridiales bacterium]|nr:hypothetical protein [Clostridiales bacterium]MCF8023798.1 hypothetical protein [Clostridiales bacterium]
MINIFQGIMIKKNEKEIVMRLLLRIFLVGAVAILSSNLLGLALVV